MRTFVCLLLSVSASLTFAASVELQEACKRTSLMYAHYADTSQATKMGSLFTENGTWQTTGGLLEGRKAIDEQMAKTVPGEVVMRHVITNHLIFEDQQGNLTGSAYFTLYRAGPGGEDITRQPVMMGTYQDTYEINGAACLFASRSSSATFRRIAK